MDRISQIARAKRLCQKRDGTGNRFPNIPADQQDFQLWPRGAENRRELQPCHAGHFKIGDEHVNGMGIGFPDGLRREGGICFNDAKTSSFEDKPAETADRMIIVNKKEFWILFCGIHNRREAFCS